MIIDSPANPLPSNSIAELDKALASVRRSLEASSQATGMPANTVSSPRGSKNSTLKRQHSVQRQEQRSTEAPAFGLFGRTRSTKKHQPSLNYETPDEEDELLDEALSSAHKAAKRLDSHAQQQNKYSRNYPPVPQVPSHPPPSLSYLTPSPSADRNSVGYEYLTATKPVDILKPKGSYKNLATQWPTPPSDGEWAASAAASIFAAGAAYR
jgi:meiosis induction protein kinase IME2/SME1